LFFGGEGKGRVNNRITEGIDPLSLRTGNGRPKFWSAGKMSEIFLSENCQIEAKNSFWDKLRAKLQF